VTSAAFALIAATLWGRQFFGYGHIIPSCVIDRRFMDIACYVLTNSPKFSTASAPSMASIVLPSNPISAAKVQITAAAKFKNFIVSSSAYLVTRVSQFHARFSP